MTDIFDTKILCKRCNVEMQQTIINKAGAELRATPYPGLALWAIIVIIAGGILLLAVLAIIICKCRSKSNQKLAMKLEQTNLIAK